MNIRDRILKWNIIGKTKLWFALSLIFITIGIIAMVVNLFSVKLPLNLGIDFLGGTLINARFEKTPSESVVKSILSKNGYSDVSVQKLGENGITLRLKAKEIDPLVRDRIFADLEEKFGAVDKDTLEVTSINPVIGRDLLEKAIIALSLALLFVLAYITFRFRFSFAAATILALLHDILVTLGLLALFRINLNAPFVGALLAIITYSVQDTVVVMDRIRENLRFRGKETFEELVNKSVTQTFLRSFNTSFTTFLAVFVLFLLGGASIKDFVLTLIFGIISGTYSSIFIASPLIVTWNKGKK